MTQQCSLAGDMDGARMAKRLMRPRLKNLYGLLRPDVRIADPDDPGSRVTPFIERLWMPAYAIQIRAVTRKGVQHIWTSVDTWSGQCALLECVDDLVLRTLRDDLLPPKFDQTRAMEEARKGLLRFIMAQRGQLDKPVIEAVEEIRLFYCAFWVYYFRRRNRIDLKVFDSFTGKTAGAKMRVAVLNALVADRNQRKTP